MNKKMTFICILLIVSVGSFITGYYSHNTNLIWFHPIDCSLDVNALACNHLASECSGTVIWNKDGISCYENMGIKEPNW